MAQASRVGDSSRVTTVQPAGTVTLVFTDVEGSTKLLDSLGPEEYRRALGEHREALRAAFERHGVLRGRHRRCTASARLLDGNRRCARGARHARDARGRPGPHQGGGPHRGADPRPAEVRRARRAPGSADHGGGARRTGAALPVDLRPVGRRLRGPGPRRAPPQGPLRAERPLPARSGGVSRGRGPCTRRTFPCRRPSSPGARAKWTRSSNGSGTASDCSP